MHWKLRTKSALTGTFCAAVLVVVAPACTRAPEEALAVRVDALFSRWNRPDSPGCVCAVMRNGTMLYARAYGSDPDRNVPLTADSVFDLGSMAKQFTAASIALLIDEGAVALDDDVRQLVPQLSTYGVRITIDDLLHHESGLRDYTALTYLAGRRGSTSMTNADVLELLARQKALNFAPGERFLYSNSNYAVLAEIVQRLSGRALPRFAEERLFVPLEMASTGFRGQRRVAPVASYRQRDDGSGYVAWVDEGGTYGDGSLFSNIRDLARWDENFYTGGVGGAALLDRLRTKGALSSGAPTDYGFGLQFAEYRGAPLEFHGGTTLGFRSELLRFPSQHFSVAVLCNTADADASGLAAKVADLYLEDVLDPPGELAPSGLTAAIIDPRVFDAYAGEYSVPAGASSYVLKLLRVADKLYAQRPGIPPMEIVPVSATEFVVVGANGRLTFHREPDGSVRRLTLMQPSGPKEALRVVSPAVDPSPVDELIGDYASDELEVTWSLAMEGGRLVAYDPAGNRLELEARAGDRFALPGDGELVIERSDDGTARGFTVSLSRASNIEFIRRPR
jgi:CubicO group peptidase (beta-lactamase class C family)